MTTAPPIPNARNSIGIGVTSPPVGVSVVVSVVVSVGVVSSSSSEITTLSIAPPAGAIA